MIVVGPGDFSPLEQFALAWRFTDQDWDDPALRRDLHPIRAARAGELHPRLSAACAAYHQGDTPSEVHIEAPCESEADAARTRQALAALAIPPATRIVVLWDDRTAIETSWRTFSTQWKSFCYPGTDDATVCPLDESWVLCYHHWEAFSFNRRAEPGGRAP